MGVVLGGPAVDEEADGDEEGAGDHEGDAELGAAGVVVFLLQPSIDAVVDGGADLGAEEEAEAEGDVIEAANADGFVVSEFPEGGEGGEDEVHEAVEVGHVDREDLDDDLSAEEDKGAGERAFHSIGEGASGVFVLGVQGRVVGFFPKFFSFRV